MWGHTRWNLFTVTSRPFISVLSCAVTPTWNRELGFDSRSPHKLYHNHITDTQEATWDPCRLLSTGSATCVLFIHHGGSKKTHLCLQVHVKQISYSSYSEYVAYFILKKVFLSLKAEELERQSVQNVSQAVNPGNLKVPLKSEIMVLEKAEQGDKLC